MKKTFFIILFLLLSSTVLAATYHVRTDGNDSTCDGTQNEAAGDGTCAWLRPWYGARQLANNDTLIIHPGTYYVEDNWICDTTLGSSCTWATVDGATYRAAMISPNANVTGWTIRGEDADNMPVLRITSSTHTDRELPIIGSYTTHTNATMKWLHIMGQMTIIGGSGATIEACEVEDGGSVQRQGQFILIDDGTGHTVYNNYLHDGDFVSEGASGNAAGIIVYESTSGEIYQNTIENALNSGVRLKDRADSYSVYRNFIIGYGDNSNTACIMLNNQDTPSSGTQKIYQNVMVNCYGGFKANSLSLDVEFYNNTIYKSYWRGIYSDGTDSQDYYNNIIVDTQNVPWFYLTYSEIDAIDYLDYNQYYDASGSATFQKYDGGTSTVATTVAAWETWWDGETYTTYADNSIEADPNFTNGSGNWNQATDFKRSSYPAEGIDRTDEIAGNNVIGAYVTGSEQIGYVAGGDITAPQLSSVTIQSSGTSIVFDFDESITESGTGSDWTTFNMSGGAVALSSPNVVSDTITYTMGRKVYQGETLYELDYTQPGNGIEDIADNDLASINNFSGSFTNGSTQQPPEVSDISGLELQ
jgi:hypothetical protein